MNNKKSILIAGIVLVLILGAVVLALVFKPKSSSTDESANPGKPAITENNPQNEETSIKGNILDLIKLGKTARCTYSTSQDDNGMTGVSYISGNNVRADFEVTTKDRQTIASHMITDGEWVYTWSSATPQGFKMKVDESVNTSADTTKESPTKALSESFDYKCTPWLADNSLFEVPSNVEFTDFSDMLKNLNTGGNCSACDYIPDEDGKATCKQQLGCE